MDVKSKSFLLEKLKTIKGVVFDVGGVLRDSKELQYICFNQAFQKVFFKIFFLNNLKN